MHRLQGFAKSIVDTVRHPLIIVDAGMRVDKANQAFYRTFGLAENETEGQPFFSVAQGLWDVPRLRTLMETIVPTGDHLEDFELEHTFPLLGRRILQLNARRVERDGDGESMVLLAIEDVTERRETAEQLQRLNLELEQRVRVRTAELEASNRELEAFSYSVSHDLRAPLRAIEGFSDELLRSYGALLDEKGKHYLERVRQASQRMAGLIDDLLKLSRLSRGELHRDPVDLSGLARDIGAELSSQAVDRDITFAIEPDLSAQGDGRLLRVALENLLGNAVKFTGKNLKAHIQFGRERRRNQPAFYVRDDGAGFDMAQAANLFGVFQRLHRERDFPGNGIGLATVQRVIHRHGGDVWAQSEPTKGATVYFTIPDRLETI